MDIAFGDCVLVGGFCYALILVNCATWYNWTFGHQTLSSEDIILALCLACCFYLDCDQKLFGSAVSKYLIDGHSKVVAAPAKCQSANSLVESHWKVMVHMAHAYYLTKKQMPRAFWFFAITHLAHMMNAISGKYSGWLAFPFLLVHGVRHDKHTWVPLFSLAYFHHEHDGNVQRSKHQAHTMDGIVISHSPTLNALMVYNPCNKKYYKPDSYHLDPYPLPSPAYPSISTMAVCSSASYMTTIPSLKRSTRQAPMLKGLTPQPICSYQGLLWIYPLLSAFPPHLRTAPISCTLSFLTMVPLRLFLCLRWLH